MDEMTLLREMRADVTAPAADQLAHRIGWRPGDEIVTPRRPVVWWRARPALDFARILATSPESREGRRRGPRVRPMLRRHPVLLFAGAAVAAIVFGAVTVPGVLPGDESGAVDPRAVLVASAEKAEQAPATTGKYWYSRVRMSERILVPADPTLDVPFRAYAEHTRESWDGRGRSRTVDNQDVKITFGSKKDETMWKKMGSPRLWAQLSTWNYKRKWYAQLGHKRLSNDDLQRLPTDADALEAWLRKSYAEERADQWWPTKPTFSNYLWGQAPILLHTATRPGTRGALYRVLAKQPWIRAHEATDPLGRAGIALTAPTRSAKGEDPGGQASLIIDPDTGQLLADVDRGFGDDGKLENKATHWTAYLAIGWTDRLGVPVQE